MTKRMPVLFLGHGNPMNALARNDYTRAWSALGHAIRRPRAVLCISAHWYQPVRAVTAAAQPATIHDLGGFPGELYEVQYPAPGDPVLAQATENDSVTFPVEGFEGGSFSMLAVQIKALISGVVALGALLVASLPGTPIPLGAPYALAWIVVGTFVAFGLLWQIWSVPACLIGSATRCGGRSRLSRRSGELVSGASAPAAFPVACVV